MIHQCEKCKQLFHRSLGEFCIVDGDVVFVCDRCIADDEELHIMIKKRYGTLGIELPDSLQSRPGTPG